MPPSASPTSSELLLTGLLPPRAHVVPLQRPIHASAFGGLTSFGFVSRELGEGSRLPSGGMVGSQRLVAVACRSRAHATSAHHAVSSGSSDKLLSLSLLLLPTDNFVLCVSCRSPILLILHFDFNSCIILRNPYVI